ncbi:helix-turn-helix domain-containing protein [Confluentibacter lentus]|uniref:helix-turn-helix domain-containing protein n=1 Tax=Confluentibacter lentus TaxID=1699412 RepID=UPI000C292853|nr:helix-turn-helix domain-containing protein [Confluentibacter lentus]
MEIKRIKSITEYHRWVGLPQPQHPLISLIDYSKVKHQTNEKSISFVMDFYSIALKRVDGIKMFYGQSEYDFDEGLMSFLAPGQVLRIEIDCNTPNNRSGYLLQIHPDFLWKSSLVKSIKQYEFFNYSTKEALFLSDKEETIIIAIFEGIKQEYNTNIDKFSKELIITQIELLLKYSNRFYNRQFITREISNHEILTKTEELLNDYFKSENLSENGLPSVQYIAEKLNISPNYLSNLLKLHTGQSTQQHIHNKLIEKAKEKLSTSNLSVSEIAFELGFEHPQSFSKFFKIKTAQSPLEFRNSFN